MTTSVDNDVYSRLGDRWYDADDDPVALLRAESRLRNPWIAQTIDARFGRSCDVLDVGCGGGFASNALGSCGHRVVGLDASAEALAVAARRDRSASVEYRRGDALALPFDDAAFDVVCAMDFLEHVEDPGRAIAEASRVLRPGGLFFFHTFNRNWLSWLVVIKAVEWFVKNTPPNLHVLRLFLKPREVASMCAQSGLAVADLKGCRPALSASLLELATTGVVPRDFAFVFSSSPSTGYCGFAIKEDRLLRV